MKRISIITLAITTIILSCKKEETSSEIAIETNSTAYFPLNKGSFWVYEHRKIDSNGTDEPYSLMLDTIRVSRDTMIDGHIYTILEGRYAPFHTKPHQIVDMIRDSSGYLISFNGEVLFAVENFNRVLSKDTGFVNRDFWYYALTRRMKYSNAPLHVKAGSFQTIYDEGSVVFNPDVEVPYYERTMVTHYARGVGKVMQRYFYSASPYTYEKRLVAYHIN